MIRHDKSSGVQEVWRRVASVALIADLCLPATCCTCLGFEAVVRARLLTKKKISMHILIVLLHLRLDAHLIAALENSSNVSFESPRAGHRVCLDDGFPMLDSEVSPSVCCRHSFANYVNIK